MQFWPPDDEHICSKHVEAWNKLIVKQKFCASSWLITEMKNFQHMLGLIGFENVKKKKKSGGWEWVWLINNKRK